MAKDETRLPGIRRGEERGARDILEGGGRSAMDDLVLSPQERRALAEYRRKAEERRQKERERMRERSGRRVDLDLAEDLKEQLERTAEREGVSVSSLVTYLLYEGMDLASQGAIDLERGKRPAGGGRHPYIMVHPRDKHRGGLGMGKSSVLREEDSADKEGS